MFVHITSLRLKRSSHEARMRIVWKAPKRA